MNNQLKTAAARALSELFYEHDGQWFAGSASSQNVTATLKPVLAALGLPVEYPPSREHLEQEEMLALDHAPLIVKVRKSHTGEKAYASMWEATMEALHDDDYPPIARVLLNLGAPITQRHASVLASVAMWLGTACGWSMLKRAEQLRGLLHPADAYLLAWTLENRRTDYVNSGDRTIEMLLGQRTVTAEDLETVDHFMRWLAEGEGQQFLDRAERLRLQYIEDDGVMLLAQGCMLRAMEADSAKE